MVLMAVVAGALLVFLLLLLLVVPALYHYVEQLNVRHQQHKGIGEMLPALSVEPLTGDGEPWTLSGLRGKVVLVNFWGTWCSRCRVELPEIARLNEDFKEEKDFVVLAVSGGAGGPEDLSQLKRHTQAFLDHEKIAMPTYADPDWVTRKAFNEVAGLPGLPTTFLMDRHGVIRDIWIGYTPGLEVAMKKQIANVLSDKSAPPAPAVELP